MEGTRDIPAEFTFELGPTMELAMLASFWLIMIAVGMSLSRASFAFLAREPRLYWAGFVSQLIALPAVTVALCHALAVSPAIGLGMILMACCPGGASSNLYTMWARGNIGLSVSLTATSSLLAALVTPLSTVFWSGFYAPTAGLLDRIDLSVVAFLSQIAITLAAPLLVGIVINAKAPVLAERWKGRIGLVGGVMLLGSTLINVTRFAEPFLALGFGILGIVVIHSVVAFATGYGIAKAVRADTASTRAITIETGIQNVGLAILIVLTTFKGLGGTFAVIGLWGTWQIAMGLLPVAWWRLRERKS